MDTVNRPPTLRTALVADDDAATRAEVFTLLRQAWPELTIVAETDNGADAWDLYLEREPDVCFLDVRMPRMTGIEVAQRIRGNARVVLMASTRDAAVGSIATMGALHLVKPLDPEQAMGVLHHLRSGDAPVPARMEETRRAAAPVRRGARIDTIPGALGPEREEVPIEDVVYLQADGRFTRIVKEQGALQSRQAFKDLVAELDPREFWQIHRHIVVNRRHIERAVVTGDSDIVLTLLGRDERLPIGPHFLARFRQSARQEL